MWQHLQRVTFHVCCLLPLAWLVFEVVTQRIGADPAEKIVRHLGFWGACMLWGTLAVTPLRVLLSKPKLVSFRRAIGLWSFAYVSLHLLAFLVVWAGLNGAIILEEVQERPYIIVGLVGWFLLIPLAITSTRGWRRRLGRRWNQLHRLVYVVAGLGMMHIAWVAKLDYLQPALFLVALIVMFLLRRLKPAK